LFTLNKKTMGLLTPKGKKGDKKTTAPKASQQSKFIQSPSAKSQGNFGKKGMTGGSQRGS
jgi:hypothetical protein